MYDTTQPNLSQHITSILSDGELDDETTHKKFLLVRTEGKRQVKRNIDHYNPDLITELLEGIYAELPEKKPKKTK